MNHAKLMCKRLVICLSALFVLMILSAKGVFAEGLDVRLAGNNRYETSFAIADHLYLEHGAYQYITIASGANYPDALSGSYFAFAIDSPMLLVDAKTENKTIQKLRSYTKGAGSVFLLGGAGSISNTFERQLKGLGYSVSRISGKDRFETNLAILRTLYYPGEELLVASGLNYPDCLSASAVPKPLLLVGNSLTKEQKDFLKSAQISRIYILGGTGSVSKSIEHELRTNYCKKVERIGGKNRFETSYLIAKRFFPESDLVTIASGMNFPDGLSGGPIATFYNSPLLLVNDSSYSYAHAFVKEKNIFLDYVFGGEGSVKQNTVDFIMTEASEALERAKEFLLKSPFSRQKLIEQIEKEGYSRKEARIAVDNSGTNWNEQAKRMAENILNTSMLSENEVIQKLILAGFLDEEAKYGAKNARNRKEIKYRPGGKYENLGSGDLYLKSPSGSTEYGDEIVLYPEMNSIPYAQIGIELWNMDGSVQTFIYIDGKEVMRHQVGYGYQTSIDFYEDSLWAITEGVHKVEAVQFKDNKNENDMIFYRSAVYTVKNR